VYASYGRGNKLGGFVETTSVPNADPAHDARIETETATSWELGTRFRARGDRFLAGATLFYMDVADFQDTTFDGTAFVTTNLPVHSEGVELEASFCEGPLLVEGDATRLAQALGNLLHNATKFTERGGWTRAAVERDEGGRAVHITVADNGIGIPAEVLPRLFEPFVQADATLDRSRGGLGLGLALVKGLVELHGGSATATSAGPGRGSEFLVHLPLQEEEPSRPEEPCAPGPRRGSRVLVIEDNVDAAESLALLLRFAGHETAVAYTGPEGLDRAREFRPEVVLCDIGLPEMDGYAVARALRADKTLRKSFLVALSGYAQPEDLERAEEAGFDRHLAKPPRIEKLEEILGEAAGQVG
jgi:CheY-like chemotaxis protein